MKKILIFALAVALCSCGGGAKKKATAVSSDTPTEVEYVLEDESMDDVPDDGNPVSEDAHTAENSLDYLGTYVGTLPAADCPGIETTLTLRKDGQFVLNETYIDRASSNSTTGKYTVKGNLLTLGISELISYYKIEEGRVRMLDSEKQMIHGKLAGHYVLRKKQ